MLTMAALLGTLAAPAAAQLGPIGLTTDGAQWFDNDDPTSPEDAGEGFGSALAAGDFNGDGADDLATGVPLDSTGASRSGSVVVRLGRRADARLVPGPVGTVLRQDSESTGEDEWFGSALAAGDFNGDSFDDLAVGVPQNDPGNRGAVRVYYGSSEGLDGDVYELIDEIVAGSGDQLCNDAHFGSALAVGNFDDDLYEDLVIGVPDGCQVYPGGTIRGGSLYVAHGKTDGLLPFFGYRIAQDSFEIYDDPENGDEFGGALAAGDFNTDGYDDLAIGVPGENSDSGAIEVVMGSQWGLLFADSVFWLPGALGEEAETSDRLGACLASGDFDGDGYADLAIGAPVEDFATGRVNVAYGAADPARFDLSRTDRLTQGSIHGPAHDVALDYFGSSLAAADFDGDGRDDLSIGHFLDDWAGLDLGAVTVLMGAVPSIGSSTRHHLIAIGWEGVPGDASQPYQDAGGALAVGDFDGSGRGDLAFGVGGYSEGDPLVDAGAEVVLYSETKVFSDGFEIGSTGRWSGVAL